MRVNEGRRGFFFLLKTPNNVGHFFLFAGESDRAKGEFIGAAKTAFSSSEILGGGSAAMLFHEKTMGRNETGGKTLVRSRRTGQR